MSFTWTTYEGKKLKLNEIEDMHLANILLWVKDRPHQYPSSVLEAFQEEAQKRKLPDWFLNKAPYPHKNEEGEWCNGIPKPTLNVRKPIKEMDMSEKDLDELQKLQLMLTARTAFEKMRGSIDEDQDPDKIIQQLRTSVSSKLGGFDHSAYDSIYDAAAAYHKISKEALIASPVCKDLVDIVNHKLVNALVETMQETFNLTEDEVKSVLWLHAQGALKF